VRRDRVIHDVRDRHRRRHCALPGAAALAVALLAGALVAGCGGGGESSSITAASTTIATSTTSTTSSPVTTTSTSTATSSTDGAKQVGAAIPAAAATTVLTSNDLAKVCGTYVTERYLRAAFGSRQGCVQAQRPGAVAQSVHIRREAVTNTHTARLTALPTGGPYDGETVRVTLVDENGAWKVDSLHVNVPVGP
jgi:hypothetical protein